MTDPGEFPETEVSYETIEEVNALACQTIEERELPYIMLAKTTKMDDPQPWTLELYMGNGINDITDVREMLIRCIDEIDVQLLRESD